MKIQDLLSNPQFSDFQLLAGMTGISNDISTVTVIDTPDGEQWLNGGELVITTAFMLNDDSDALLKFIRLLSIKKISGLCIKTGRYIQNIPDCAIELCNQLNIPLILIPTKYAFADIINIVLRQIINQQAIKIMQANVIHTKFTELALMDATIPEILKTLSTIISFPCACLDLYSKKLWFSDEKSYLANKLNEANADLNLINRLESFDHVQIANQNKKYGYLFFEKGILENYDDSVIKAAVENAITNIILRQQTLISNRQVAEQYKNEFIHDLIINNIKSESEIHNRASIYGWDFHNGGIVAAVDINNIKKRFTEHLSSNSNKLLENITSEIFNISIEEIKKQFTQSYYMKLSDIIAFIITIDKNQMKNLKENLNKVFKRIQARIKEFPFTITLGAGTYYENISNIHKSYKEARATINLGYTLDWYDRLMFYEEMDIYRVLTPVLEDSEAFACCQKYLQPLKDYDLENGKSLMQTLKNISYCDWNYKLAAERMFLHPNSVKYRFNQICNILDLDLKEHNNRLIIEIALIIDMMQNQACFSKNDEKIKTL